jgi:hypothetical protein
MTPRSLGVIGPAFWQRLVGRYRRRTAVCRPRVPLVFRRSPTGAGPVAERIVRLREPSVAATTLHVHLAWPGWLRPAGAGARATRSGGAGAAALAIVHSSAARMMTGTPGLVAQPARPWPAVPRAHRQPGAPSARLLPALPLRPVFATANGGQSATASPRRRPRLITVRATEAVFATGQDAAPASGLPARDLIQRVWRRPEGAAEESSASRPVHRAARPAAEAAWSRTLRLVQRLRDASHAGDTPSPSFPSGGRLFQPAPRTLAQPAPAAAAFPPAPALPASPPVPAAYASASRLAPPQLDIASLSEEVYRQLERRARIERERRGR